MPSERDAVQRWLDDLRHHIAMAEGFVDGMTYETFKNDNLHIFAVTRCLEIISEASRRLPQSLKDRHPAIAWKEMAAAGNIYRHEYEDVAPREIWDTVILHLPPLLVVIDAELQRLNPR